MIARLSGIFLVLIAAWIAKGSIDAIQFQQAQTGTLDGVFADPVYVVPLTASGLAGIGGLLAVLNINRAFTLGTTGSALYGVFGLLILAAGAQSSLWAPKLAVCALMLVFCIGILKFRRQSR